VALDRVSNQLANSLELLRLDERFPHFARRVSSCDQPIDGIEQEVREIGPRLRVMGGSLGFGN
jgi:hypothetical protein